MATNYTLTITADSYAQLRKDIAELAEQHGLLTQEAVVDAAPASITAVDDQHMPDPKADEKQAEGPQKQDTAAEEPVQGNAAEDAEELVWYHQPDAKKLWQETEQPRRKGIYKLHEKTAKDLLAKYAEEESHDVDSSGESESEAEVQEEKQSEPVPETDESDTAGGETEQPEEVTLDDVRQAVMAFAKANGNPQGKALVAKYGAGKISEIPQSEWAALRDEALAGAGGA